MATSAKNVINQALELSAAERIAVAEQLLNSIESPDAEIDLLWANEAKSRLEAFKSGDVQTSTLDEVFSKYRK